MLELREIFIIIKLAKGEKIVYLDDDGKWTEMIYSAKEFDTEFAGRTALKQKLDEEEDVVFNVMYKVDGFLKTVYVR